MEVIGAPWRPNRADPQRKMFRHKLSRIIHCVADEVGDVLACGTKISANFVELSEGVAFPHPLCKTCHPAKEKLIRAGPW